MKLIDLHCDTFSRMHEEKIYDIDENNLHIDLKKLKKADSFIQVFALFDNKEITGYNLEEYNKLLDFAFNIIENNQNKFNLIKNYEDIKDNNKQNILVSTEDMGSIRENLENIKYYYNRGIRMGSITWNHENSLAYPNTMNPKLGLKKFGKEAVEYMESIGMIIDVSHLNDGGFYDVADITKEPFIASHSCSRTLCSNSRNLKDDMIKIIAGKGGIIGINFYSLFLSKLDKKTEEMIHQLIKEKNYTKADSLIYNFTSKNDDIIKHISHIRNIGGSEAIAFGSDFDGISCNLEMKDISGIQTLIPLLKKSGFSENEIEKLYYKNALRLFKDIL
ncbi:membrane dipeptidase [Anaerofustis sp.]|uniref:dipeptidase n=1 Tax=Anaerofustis sp. TaxID=1872517 RepID=UPI0025B9C7C8|nr:membrane dipeptidase [Anaerofustis sp.]